MKITNTDVIKVLKFYYIWKAEKVKEIKKGELKLKKC